MTGKHLRHVFANRLRMERAVLGWSQQHLADAIETKQVTVVRWEHCQVAARLSSVCRAAEALRCSVSHLLGGSERYTDESFGERFVWRFKRRGRTVPVFCAISEISDTTVRKWLSRDADPHLDHLAKAAAALRCSPWWLAGGIPDPDEEPMTDERTDQR